MRQWFATDSKSGRRAVSTLSKNVNSIESKNNCVSRKSVSLWTPPVAPSFPSASFVSLRRFLCFFIVRLGRLSQNISITHHLYQSQSYHSLSQR